MALTKELINKYSQILIDILNSNEIKNNLSFDEIEEYQLGLVRFLLNKSRDTRLSIFDWESNQYNEELLFFFEDALCGMNNVHNFQTLLVPKTTSASEFLSLLLIEIMKDY